ncbi:hypothetical protein FXO37_07591 [Capsicum annuum]|nr:hypothetical protein FXO37_07591 [Capsicum annuum]
MWNEPKEVKELNKVRVQASFASDVIFAAIADNGSLWVWGTSKRGYLVLAKESPMLQYLPKLKHFLEKRLLRSHWIGDDRIGKIGRELEISPLESNSTKLRSKGESFATEVTEKSVIEAIEKEKDMPIIWEPGLIEDLYELKATDVTCGLDHSLALCCKSHLLMSREDPDNIPKVVEGLAGETPVSVLGGPTCKEIMVSGNTWGYVSAKHQYMVNNSKICACVKSDYTNS